MDKQSSIIPNVEGFILWLTGALTQYDTRASKRRGYSPYALGHYMGAVGDIKKEMRSKLKSDAPEDLEALKKSIDRHLSLPPSDRAIKVIDQYLQTGKAPNYPGTRAPRKRVAERVFSRFAASFSQEDLAVLVIFDSLKPSGRADVLSRAGLGEYSPQNPNIKSLMDKELIKLRGKAMMLNGAKAKEIMKQHPVPEKYKKYLGLTNPSRKFKKEASDDDFLTVEEIADICPKCAFEMVTAGVLGAYRSDLNRIIEAAKWDKLPKGWTQDSVKKFWASLTGDVQHRVTKCIKKMEGKVSDSGAFCASLARRVER